MQYNAAFQNACGKYNDQIGIIDIVITSDVLRINKHCLLDSLYIKACFFAENLPYIPEHILKLCPIGKAT